GGASADSVESTAMGPGRKRLVIPMSALHTSARVGLRHDPAFRATCSARPASTFWDGSGCVIPKPDVEFIRLRRRPLLEYRHSLASITRCFVDWWPVTPGPASVD